MKLKTKWIYNYKKGLKGAMVSNDYYMAEDNYLYCVDKNTGEELMPKKKTKGVCRNIIVCEETLILLSDKGQVECFEIND